LCFGLGLEEQSVSGFSYDYSIYQVEYSRNLLFASGAEMEVVSDRIVDRTCSRFDVRQLRTLFGHEQRPRRRSDGELSPREAVVIETPLHDLTVFKVHFGLLTLKAYSKGEHVLRFAEIVARLSAMLARSRRCSTASTSPSCPVRSWTSFPCPSRLGATRVGGIDLNKTRMRAVFAGMVALAASPKRFTVVALTQRVHSMTGQSDYSTRQTAYDLRKLRAKRLVVKPESSRRYRLPPEAARSITALSVLRDQVASPILAAVRSPR
jgi:hypothetical protein